MASPKTSPSSQTADNTQTSITESNSTPEGPGAAHQRPTSHPSEPPADTDSSHHPECSLTHIITYTRRELLHLQSSPLVQPPEGMPLLKDWFGDGSEQHIASQAKKDGGDANGSTGTRRFPRRDHEEGDNTGRTSFRSTLSQPSQMGNFKHHSLRGELTRTDRERERERDRDRDNERDKEGHERLRSLSDMYDRDRMTLPLTLPPLMRSQQRDAAPHVSSSNLANATPSGRLGTREGRDRSDRDKDRDKDRDRDRDGGRRGENRESGRRKGGESGDWRRGEMSRGKDEHARRDQDREGGERDRSPEVERSRRDHSVSRERWTDRARDRDDGRDTRREPKGRDRDRDRDRERDREYHGSSSRAWRDDLPSRLRDDDERDTKDKDIDKGRDRTRDDDRRTRLKDGDGHPERSGNGRDRWSDRVRDGDRSDDRRKGRDDGDKETKEERRERERERREKDRERAREHPDAKRDRELREGWTIAEEREARPALAASGNSRRGAGRGGERRQVSGAGGDEERETTRRDRDKEPAWMDDYVPEPGSNKAGIFGGKVEGLEDEIQAWKKKQNAGTKSAASNGPQTVEPSNELLHGGIRDGAETTANAKISEDFTSNDEQAKAAEAEAFFFGLMRSDSSKAKNDATGISDSSTVPNTTTEPSQSDAVDSAKHSPAPGITLSTSRDTSKSDATAIPLSAPQSNTPSSQTAKSTNPRPSPAPSSSSAFPANQGQLGSNALLDQPPAKSPSSQSSVPFNPPQQSRVLAFSAQSQQAQAPSDGQLRSHVGQGPSASSRPGVIGPQPSPQPGRIQPSPRASDMSSRVPSLTEQATQRIQAAENMHHRSVFSPFDTSGQAAFSASDASRHAVDSGSFAPSRQAPVTSSPVDSRGGPGAGGEGVLSDGRNPRLSPQAMLSNSSQGLTSYEGSGGPSVSPNSAAAAATASSYASGRGSRFAKFWDVKTKEAAAAGFMQAQAAAGIMSQQQQQQQQQQPPPPSVSPSAPPGQRDHGSANGFLGNAATGDNIQDMLTMLQNSTQANRMNTQVNAMGGATNQGLHRQHASHLQALHEQQQQQQQQQPIPHHQPQPQHHFSNPTSLLENHHPFENRPFVPDGMVPGLRPPPLPRTTREGGGMQGALSAPMYSDGMDDSPFTVQQRVPPLGSGVHQQQQQQQVYEPLVGRGSLPQLYGNAGVGGTRGGGGGGMFQVPFRAEPSPLGGQGQQQQQQQQVQPPPPQRLPPGLANLGGRPPHDPNGYLGGMGMHGPGVGHQQAFNGFGGGGGIGFGGGMGVGHGPPPQQPRGPPAPPPPPPMQTLLNNAHNALSGSGHGGEFTVQHHPGVRGPPPSGQGQQQQGMMGGMRFGGQGGHLGSGHGLRQQQGPHMVPQMLPMHLQQQQQQQQQQQAAVAALHGMHGGGGGQSQNEHLLSMLMGGIPRE